MLNRALLELYKNTLFRFEFDENKTQEVKRRMYLSYLQKTVEGAAKKELYREFGYNINKREARKKSLANRIFNTNNYNPEKIVINKEIKNEIHQMLRSKLTDRQYKVIRGIFYNDKSQKEIALELDCSEPNVSKLKQSAFKRLRECTPSEILNIYNIRK